LPAVLEASEYASTHRVIQVALHTAYSTVDVMKYRMLGIFQEDAPIPFGLIRIIWKMEKIECRAMLQSLQTAVRLCNVLKFGFRV
jgi:hypothetical protein